jgi:hypothetical protein
MNFRNPVYAANNWIMCEIDHPVYGWIPFLADPLDTGAEFDVAELYDRMSRSPSIQPYVPVPEVVIIPDLSFPQLLIGLVAEQWITEVDGDAWLAGTLPSAVLGVISSLPTQMQFPAKARALRPSVVIRADPLVAALAAYEGKTPEELDEFFLTYSQV